VADETKQTVEQRVESLEKRIDEVLGLIEQQTEASDRMLKLLHSVIEENREVRLLAKRAGKLVDGVAKQLRGKKPN
jgi:preprotein translocase subunit SecD